MLMAILDGRTAAEVADMLRFAAERGASTGALSMLDEATLAFRQHPGVMPALQEFSAARFAYQRHGETGWQAVVEAARSLAAALEPLGEAQVPAGWNA
jgi:hypothetical protein